MDTNRHSQSSIERLGGLKAVVVLTVALSFLISAGVATALGAFATGAGDSSDDHGNRDKARTKVAEGSSASYGRWRLYRSVGSDGECLGIELLDQQPPGGGRAIFNGCGIPKFDLARISDPNLGTLFFGRVPEVATSVTISSPGDAVLTSAARPGAAEATGDFFVTSAAGEQVDGKVTAEALDVNDKVVARRTLGD